MKQKYHLEPDRGLLNDPNGLAYFHGKYYVFFQWNRFAKDHSYKEWGLFRSKDLLHWSFEGSALLPDQSYDRDGVYSGSACVINDRLFLFYTGNTKPEGRRKVHQCLAVSKDGERYLKYGPVLETPKGYTEHFRDPKVFQRKDGRYAMVIGAQQASGKGAISLAESDDGIHWLFKGNIARSREYEMVECPDLFELDGKYVLLFGLQKRNNDTDECLGAFSACKVLDDKWPFGDVEADLDTGPLLDRGFDFYAPQTFPDAKGRRLLFGWMSRMDDQQERIFSENEKYIHCLTLPRELHVKDGRLYQKIPKEYEELKGVNISLKHLSEGCKRADFPERTAFISLKRSNSEEPVSIYFPEDETEIRFEDGEFIFQRKNWVTNESEIRKFQLNNLNSMEIWLDSSSIEVFLNGGSEVLSARIYPGSERQTALFTGLTGEETVDCRRLRPVQYIQ